MTVTIYDAVDVAALPPSGYYLGYIDGKNTSSNYAAVKAAHPGATILSVTTTGLNRARICDVESGDATPVTAAAGVRAGLFSTIYSDVSTKASLDVALAGLRWNWYAANPTGVAHIVPGAVATQWAWPGHGSPGNYDISWALESWVNPAPPPPPIGGHPPMWTYDPTTGGFWATDANGDLYAENGAPFIAGLNQHPDYHAGAQESGGTNPCVGMTTFKDKNGQIGIVYITTPPGGTGGTPYAFYRFARNGQAD